MTCVYKSQLAFHGAVQTQIKHIQKCGKLNLTIVASSRQTLNSQGNGTSQVQYSEYDVWNMIYRRILSVL